jgi:hypothetical protein
LSCACDDERFAADFAIFATIERELFFAGLLLLLRALFAGSFVPRGGARLVAVMVLGSRSHSSCCDARGLRPDHRGDCP